MKKYIIIMLALLLSSKLYSQHNDFVRLDGKKFMLGCDEFYPKALNFRFSLDKLAISGIETITPHYAERKSDSCGIYRYNNLTAWECRQRLKAQFQMVKDLGFNCIRLLGMEIYVDKNYAADLNPRIHYPCPWETCPWPLGQSEMLDSANYNHAFRVLDSILAIAAEVDLKVIYLVGGGKVDSCQTYINRYADYLAEAAKHFSNNPALMAYDLYNEPGLFGFSHYFTQNDTNHNKKFDFDATLKWYRAIRDNTPNQLVTMGIHGLFSDIFDWDPGVLPVDFFSLHYYSYRDTLFQTTASYFKWSGENIEKPWIIGETGFPADNVLHIYNGDTLSRWLYPQIQKYADTVLWLNAHNGSSGFSWWIFHDNCIFGDNDPLITENYFGLMNKTGYTTTTNPNLPRVDGTRKLDSALFTEYNPGYSAPTAPLPPNYYNMYGYPYTKCTGRVTKGGQPVKDAILQGWHYASPNQRLDNNWIAPVPTKDIYNIFYTFTNDTGGFVLKTNWLTSQGLKALYISYPGYSLYGGWFDVPSDTNVSLTALTLNYGNGITNFNDFVIRKGDTLVWNDPMSMPGNLIIEDSAKLTVTSTVFFNSTGKVVVKPRGCLVVDGGRLTSGCDDTLWVGVEIQGDPNRQQIPAYQGYVQLKDSASIENAIIGLHCVLNEYSPQDNKEINYASGGIIEADTAFFKNNQISVKIENYFSNTTYNSTIKNCEFTSDRNTTSVSYVMPIHIKLSNIEDVAIYANTFKGNENGSRTLSGTGIEALDATFMLNNIWSTTKPNKFSDLACGIKCMNSSSVYNPEISLTKFTDCWRAIYLSGVTDAKVLGDTISYKSQSSTSEAYGIYLDNCDGYQVEGNVMSWSNSGDKPEFGIIINNSGENDNEIYRNTFEEIEVPLNAQNVNREYYGSTGLQLLCNNIINCTVNDITVTYEEADTCNGIRMNQGEYQFPNIIPAGNLFTYGSGSYLNYTNSSPHLVYYAHYDTATVIYYNGIPHYIKPIVNMWIAEVSNQNTLIRWDSARWVGTDCRDFTGLSGGKSLENISGLKEQIKLLQPRIDSANVALLKKMDNGNTAALIVRINSCPISNYGQLFSDLKKYSPYISEKVLLALINKQGFQTNLLYNLMILNPQVAKTYWLMDALKQVQPPLITIQFEKIKEKYKEFSEMEIERMNIGALVYKRDNAYNIIERYYAHDTMPKANDSLIRILEQDPRVTAKYNLVNQYFALNDTVKANELMGKIPNIYYFDANAKEDLEKFKLLCNVKKQLIKDGKNYSNMTEQQKQLLIGTINKPSLSFSEMNSLNALRQVDVMPVGKTGNIRVKSQIPIYEEPILRPIENMEKDLENNGDYTKPENLFIESLMEKVLSDQFNLLLYPNPANEEVNILYNTGVEVGKLSIELSDVTGRTVGKYSVDPMNNIITIKTHNYNKGIYYVILIADGKRMKVEKLVIQ